MQICPHCVKKKTTLPRTVLSPKLIYFCRLEPPLCLYQAGLLNHSDASPLQGNISGREYIREESTERIKVPLCFTCGPGKPIFPGGPSKPCGEKEGWEIAKCFVYCLFPASWEEKKDMPPFIFGAKRSTFPSRKAIMHAGGYDFYADTCKSVLITCFWMWLPLYLHKDIPIKAASWSRFLTFLPSNPISPVGPSGPIAPWNARQLSLQPTEVTLTLPESQHNVNKQFLCPSMMPIMPCERPALTVRKSF